MPFAKKASYQDDWRNEDKYMACFKPVDHNPHVALCILCNKNISLSNMGRSALESHIQGTKHKKKASALHSSHSIQNFTTYQPREVLLVGTEGKVSRTDPDKPQGVRTEGMPASSTAVSTASRSASSGEQAHPVGDQGSASPVPTSKSATSATTTQACTSPTAFPVIPCIMRHMVADDVTLAEIRWCLFAVEKHLSLRTAAAATNAFSQMFPDSKIASRMQCERTKTAYMIAFGLAPYFREKLQQDLQKADAFVACFDESLNKCSQDQQMDIAVIFWGSDSNEVTCRYFNSAFLGNSCSKDLMVAFRDSLKPHLEEKKLMSISMDGPNVNFKFLADLEKELILERSPDEPMFIFMGSCGLHTLHNSFKVGNKDGCKWDIAIFLRNLYNFFKNAPARRAHFRRLTGSQLLPSKFCSVRWLTNDKSATRALVMLPVLLQFKRCVENNPDEKPPNCYSWQVLSKYLGDKLLPLKLSFFSHVASLMEPFLKDYQTEHPMAPFLYSDLTAVMSSLLSLFVKEDVLSATTNILKIDFRNKNLIESKNFSFSFSVRSELKKLKIQDTQLLQFKKECIEMLKKMCTTLQRKSPLNYGLCRFISFCDPRLLSEHSDLALKRLERALEIFSEKKWLEPRDCDIVLSQFKSITSREVVKSALKNFDRSKQRLDHFWRGVCFDNTPSGELLCFLKKVLIFSHGNAFVERGFSANKEMIEDNLLNETLVSYRLVYDAIKQAGGYDKILIDKNMIFKVRRARSRKQEYLEQKRKEENEARERAMMKRKAQQQLKDLGAKKLKLLAEKEMEAQALEQHIAALKCELNL